MPDTTVAIEIRSSAKELVEARAKDGTIRQRVVDALAEEEMSARVKALISALGKRDEACKAVNKIKPDQFSFDANGAKISESYSKNEADTLKRAREALEDMYNVIKLLRSLTAGQALPLEKGIST